MPGGSLIYSVVVTNNGPSAVVGASVSDVVPVSLSGVSWSCAGAVGGVCGAVSGSGSIAETVDLPVGGSVTYTIGGTVDAGARGLLVNTASVGVPVGVTDPVPGNNAATDTDALVPRTDLSIAKSDGVASVVAGGLVYVHGHGDQCWAVGGGRGACRRHSSEHAEWCDVDVCGVVGWCVCGRVWC